LPLQAEAAGQVADARADVAREAQRRQHAEADADEARSAAIEADAQMTDALTATATAEQAAVAARETAQARVGEAERDAAERVLAAQQERDRAVAAAHGRADDAETRARTAELETAQAQHAAESARAELDRARHAADQQVALIREDAARERTELRAAFETHVAAVEGARADLRNRAEHAEAELQHARADRDQAAGQLVVAQGRLSQLRDAAAIVAAACKQPQDDQEAMRAALGALTEAARIPGTTPASWGSKDS
jgi:colicin import membrane protein